MSTPSLPAVIEARARALMAGMRFMEPARVTEYDHVTQKCSAQPLIMSRRRNADGDIVAEPRAVIGGIPVEFTGSGDNSITWKVKPGDIVMLVYSSASLTRWLLHGGEVDPADGRRQNVNDAVAVPGLRCFNSSAPGGAAPIDSGASGGVTSDDAMVIAAPEIRIGAADATDHAIKGETYRSAEDTLLTALGVFATALGALNPLTAAAAATTLNGAITTFKGAAASYLASVVKVK